MQNKRNGYYDIEFDDEKILEATGAIDEIFRLQDIRNRKLYLNEGIDQYTVHEVVRHILAYNKDDVGIEPDKRRPILLYVVSNGGEVDSGFELIDTIKCSKTPIYTINLGYQYSMGFLIGLAGHKRYAMNNAKFLMHDGNSFVWDSGAKAQDRMKFNECVDNRIKDYVIQHSKLTPEEYDSKLRVEWYMFADEAKEKGFIDYIIGKDCDIDEVI